MQTNSYKPKMCMLNILFPRCSRLYRIISSFLQQHFQQSFSVIKLLCSSCSCVSALLNTIMLSYAFTYFPLLLFQIHVHSFKVCSNFICSFMLIICMPSIFLTLHDSIFLSLPIILCMQFDLIRNVRSRWPIRKGPEDCLDLLHLHLSIVRWMRRMR